MSKIRSIKRKQTDEFKEDLVKEVVEDFERRRLSRRPFELQWRLNMNFAAGNQFCYISGRGEIEENERNYFWQQREVFNHIAPIIDSRSSKLGRVRPKMSVVPATGDDADIYTAKLSTKVLESVYSRLNVDEMITSATVWSELCGTSFYKLAWDESGGRKLKGADGTEVYEGDVRIDVCTPFEIYPDDNFAPSMDSLRSIIHARALPVERIYELWNVQVDSERVEICSADYASGGGMGYSAGLPTFTKTEADGMATLIEKYERPSAMFPEGRLIIVAGGKLLYYGSLPFINGTSGSYDLPFVRQQALERAGSFWGVSVIERAIPIQRAYNAVKNRKHEFLNRISVGVLTVEDGSVDTDNLEEEGLSPGKILVYRQGSNPPNVLSIDRLPAEFNYEEDRLLNEFITITGVSEIMRNSAVPAQVTSGVALQLLVEQDDTRLAVSAGLIRRAVRDIGKHILRLYKQFAGELRLSRVTGENGAIELVYWKASDLSDNDIVFDTETEVSATPAGKRSVIYDMLRAGLLNEPGGGLSGAMRARVLDMLGFGAWHDEHDVNELHIKRAASENLKLVEGEVECEEIDDHALHIAEHTRFMLSGEYELRKTESMRRRFLEHIRIHKAIAAGVAEAAAQQ